MWSPPGRELAARLFHVIKAPARRFRTATSSFIPKRDNFMKNALRIVVGMSLATLGSSTTAAAMPPYISNSTTWTQPAFPTSLGDASSHFCYLSGLTGRFAGGGEWVRVWEGDQSSGNVNGIGIGPATTWWVGGASQQQGVTASANCLPYSTFKAEPGSGSVDNWTGWMFQTTPPNGANPTCDPFFGCTTIGSDLSFNAWQGDSVLTVSGIIGEFNGGGEFVQENQAATPAAFNTFRVDAESYNGVGGWTQALFVGIPQSGFNPSFFGPSAGPATAAAAGIFSASAGAGNFQQPSTTTIMAPTSRAVCFLTEVGGALGGGGESIQIGTQMVESTEFWTLTVKSQQPNGTFASARCYALDQSKSL
jgi:hypothetical protein